MLTYLELKNYIFIKELKLEFDEKFNIFTGETGAGKSIIVEAIALLCGEKQRSCVVGEFADKCEITGIFEIQNHKIKETLEELLKDTELELNHQLILRREIDKQNRSKFYLNDKLVSLTLVKTFFDIVVDIHGQNEHQKLLSSTHQLATIDRYAEIDEEIKKFKSDYNIYKKKLLLIENLKTELQYNKQQYELLNYQITEIEQAHLTPEDELLEEELEKAKNVEKILNLLSDLKFNLVEIKEKIANVVRIFQILKNYIPSIDDKTTQVISSEVDNLNLQIEEYKKTFSNYTTEYIDSLIDRVDLIKKLKRKYGNSIQEIQKYYENIKTQLQQITTKDEHLQQTEQEINQLEEELLNTAIKISKIRKQCIKKLEKEINAEFASLGLQKAKIEIKIDTLPAKKENLTSTGLDKIEFLVSTNPGTPFLPLRDIVSGGELSRIMLAIKTVLGKKEETPILVFDEIDAGVSGPMGFTIGKKLKHLALQNKQIFCITHLPQIACFADRHFVVKKFQLKDKTIIEAEILEDNLKINEIARMLSGSKIDEISLKHARNLIKEANESINEKV